MRTWSLWVSLLFVVGAMAGCLGDDGDVEVPTDDAPVVHWILDAAGNPVDAAAYGGELPVFELLKSSDRISGEPTLGVTRSGAVFYAAIDFDAGCVPGQGCALPRTHYVRSLDQGATWENKSPQMAGVETHPTSFDPYVYVDPTTGRVYAMDMGPDVLCNKVSWSDDDGETWVTREGACIPGVNDHPSLFAGPAAPWTNTAIYPNQLYLCTNQITDTICYQSPDGGINWFAGAPTHLGVDVNRGPEDGVCGGLAGHGHASWANGTVYLGRSWCGEVSVAVSQDFGMTWSLRKIAADDHHAPFGHDVSIATDKVGNAYAFWAGDSGRAVFLSISRDQGMSWSFPMNVTAPNVTALNLPSIVAGDEGHIAFLYVGTETPLGWAVDDQDCTVTDGPLPTPVPVVSPRTRECEWKHPDELNATTWNAYIGMSLSAASDAPIFATVLGNHPDEPLKRGDCAGRCFGDEGGMYDFLDIDIDPQTGDVWAALVDVCSAECDGPGKLKGDVTEKAVGAVARLVSGTPLLAEPIPQR